MKELDTIQDSLTSEKMRTAFYRVQDHFARSVERHETQHRIDLSGRYHLPMPEELAAYVGERPEGYLGKGGLQSSAIAECSAYLSEIARDPLTPQLNLTLLVTHLLNPRLSGTGESFAALVIVEGLADLLEIDHYPLRKRRRINRPEVARVYEALIAIAPEQMQDTAYILWAQLFGTDLPDIELISR